MADYYDDSFAYDDDAGPSSPMMAVSSPAANGLGLGSLADELAAAWSDEEGDDIDDGEGGLPLSPTPIAPAHRRHASVSSIGSSGSHRKRFARLSNETASSILSDGTSATSTTSTSKPPVRHHRRLSSSVRLDLNGSDDGIPPSLEEKIDQIESEALRGLSMVKSWSRRQRAGLSKRRGGINGIAESEETDGEDEDPICRLLEGLQSLGSQSGIETGAQRLITAHNSLSTHVQNQSRALRDISLLLNAPGTTVTTAPPRLNTQPVTISSKGVPPAVQPLRDLQGMHTMTLQLVSHFAALSDAIHMVRQQSNAASRKLRGAKDAVREWKLEVETVETARRWIDDGDWDARLRRREAAGVCREVLGGFEDVIRGMERRIEGMC
ncbi:hypothetical protein DRE_04050 [Drechslerella stenobrocha 248]|uniref:Uncharacterized protein n=1 Tax=Drechslerella stenobrocha 248 TaxID=1043628 RepID=W7ICH1_9PEZI|nr:hypothetical protein DRE_04050 [Drechslerella stenobrocha 248]